MASIVSCPSCTAPLRVKSWQIGEEMPCPSCGRVILVPEPTSIDGEDSTGKRSHKLPPRRRKKSRKEKSRAEDNNSNEPEAPESDSSNGAFPISVKAIAAGFVVMACGIVCGLLVWNFLLDDHTPPAGEENLADLETRKDDADSEAKKQTSSGDREDSSGDSDTTSESESNVVAERVEQSKNTGNDAAVAKPESPVILDMNETAKAEPPPPVPPVEQKQKRTVAETIEFLKSATVFVKVTSTEGSQTGSGFLLEAKNDTGLIVTNAHVIEPEAGKLTQLNCVFHSGTKKEFSVKAKVLSKDVGADLAILEVTHNGLPEPFEQPKKMQLFETLPVLVLGFPFGEALKAKKDGNPAITVSKGTVSSIRKNDYDRIAVLQIDGGINQGNSGGPVVTEDGALLGVSVAKVSGTEIGLAIPQHVLSETLRGRIASVRMAKARDNGDNVIYQSTVQLVDPKKNIRSATLLTCPAEKARGQKPGKDGRWSRLTKEMQETALKLNGSSAAAAIQVPRTATGSVFQIAWTLKDGTELVTAPINFRKVAGQEVAAIEPGLDEIVEQPDGRAGPRVIALPVKMTDFAMNPKTGDIAAVDATRHEAHLLRAEHLAKGNGGRLSSMKLGETPISITFKQFGDKAYFAAVCTRDSHLFLIDADKFTLQKKVPLTGAGISAVTCSSNPADPFVYYNFGSGHGSAVGAVDLRDMVDCGQVFNDSMDCAISADGKMAYRRGPWTPSGFDSLVLAGDLEASKPVFVPLHDEHRSTPAFFPDPFGDYTAAGRDVYNRSLEKRISSLNFAPEAFFRDRPVLVGMEGLSVLAASYNTLKTVGVAVRLPNAVGGAAPRLPRGVPGQADFKVVGYRRRLLADDSNERVVYGFLDKLALVPLETFQIPAEPFLAVDVEDTHLTVGQTKKITVKPRDARVSIRFDDLPLGAKQTDDGIEWTPVDADVGTEKISVTMSFADIRKTRELLFNVTQPSTAAPFEVSGFSISEDGSRIVCWSGPALDRYGRPQQLNENEVARVNHVGLIDPAGNEASRVGRTPFQVRQALLVGEFVAILPAVENSRVEIYDIADMKRTKTLLATEPLSFITSKGDQLLLHGSQSIDVYSMATLKRVRSLGNSQYLNPSVRRSSQLLAFLDGVIVNGVLHDPTGEKPLLIVSPNHLQALPSADGKLYAGSFLRRGFQQTANSNLNYHSHSRSSGIVAGPAELASRRLKVSVEQTATQVRVGRSSSSSRLKQELSLIVSNATGGRIARVPILKTMTPASTNQHVVRPLIQVSGTDVYVVYGTRIFHWSPDRLEDLSIPNKDDVAFHVVPKQTTFELQTGQTELRHTVRGGKAPYEFVLFTRLDGVTIDEDSGVVTVDQTRLPDLAIDPLLRYGGRAKSAADVTQQLQTMALNGLEVTTKLLGHKPNGYPIAVPIHFKVIDDDGLIAEMQYFVIADIPFEELSAKIFARAQQLQSK